MKLKVIFLSTLFLFAAFNIFAAGDDPAILSRGPIPQDGIEFLGVNAIPAQYGEYRYGDDIVTVYYTEEMIYLSDDWIEGFCGNDGIRIFHDQSERITAVYSDKKNWTAFLSFKADSEYICAFIDVYRSRQNYFLNIARDKSVFSFPAFLEVE